MPTSRPITERRLPKGAALGRRRALLLAAALALAAAARAQDEVPFVTSPQPVQIRNWLAWLSSG